MSKHRRDEDQEGTALTVVPDLPATGAAVPPGAFEASGATGPAGALEATAGVTPAPARPTLRVIKGEPTPEELAVLLAVVSARGSAAPEEPVVARRGGWGDPARLVRLPLRPGVGAWRTSH